MTIFPSYMPHPPLDSDQADRRRFNGTGSFEKSQMRTSNSHYGIYGW